MKDKHVQPLVQLVRFVRACAHVETKQAADADGDAWCLACGSVRLQGQWVAPGWFQALDRQMMRWADDSEGWIA